MAMLAEPRQKRRYKLVPKGKALFEDEERFGTKMLQKMGWTKGKGLGMKENGDKDFIRITYKNDVNGLGFLDRDDQWMTHGKSFNNLLDSLKAEKDDETPMTGLGFNTTEESKNDKFNVRSLEEISEASRARVHYKKFTRGKDISKYSEKDLANIFGKKNCVDTVEKENVAEILPAVPVKSGMQIINAGVSINDYFKMKMELLKTKRAAVENDQDPCLGNEVCTKKSKQRRIDDETPDVDNERGINQDINGPDQIVHSEDDRPKRKKRKASNRHREEERSESSNVSTTEEVINQVIAEEKEGGIGKTSSVNEISGGKRKKNKKRQNDVDAIVIVDDREEDGKETKSLNSFNGKLVESTGRMKSVSESETLVCISDSKLSETNEKKVKKRKLKEEYGNAVPGEVTFAKHINKQDAAVCNNISVNQDSRAKEELCQKDKEHLHENGKAIKKLKKKKNSISDSCNNDSKKANDSETKEENLTKAKKNDLDECINYSEVDQKKTKRKKKAKHVEGNPPEHVEEMSLRNEECSFERAENTSMNNIGYSDEGNQETIECTSENSTKKKKQAAQRCFNLPDEGEALENITEVRKKKKKAGKEKTDDKSINGPVEATSRAEEQSKIKSLPKTQSSSPINNIDDKVLEPTKEKKKSGTIAEVEISSEFEAIITQGTIPLSSKKTSRDTCPALGSKGNRLTGISQDDPDALTKISTNNEKPNKKKKHDQKIAEELSLKAMPNSKNHLLEVTLPGKAAKEAIPTPEFQINSYNQDTANIPIEKKKKKSRKREKNDQVCEDEQIIGKRRKGENDVTTTETNHIASPSENEIIAVVNISSSDEEDRGSSTNIGQSVSSKQSSTTVLKTSKKSRSSKDQINLTNSVDNPPGGNEAHLVKKNRKKLSTKDRVNLTETTKSNSSSRIDSTSTPLLVSIDLTQISDIEKSPGDLKLTDNRKAEEVGKKSSTKVRSNEENVANDSETIYTISTFCAEKFRNVELNQFQGSNLKEIIGYGYNKNIRLNIKKIKEDQKRILQLWSGVLNKYNQGHPRKNPYNTYLRNARDARREKGKIPNMHVKHIKRKQVFQGI